MTLSQAYRLAVRRLKDAGVPSPAFDAACIFEKHTGVKKHRLVLEGDLPAPDLTAFWADVARREAREPLQYLLGEWEFMGLRFKVGSGVLIPRPDTELLARRAIAELRPAAAPVLLELCAGSGCVSVAAARNVPGCEVYCLEISPAAIGYLKENIRLHGVADRVYVIEGDLFDFEKSRAGIPDGLDALICNPPYIPSGEIEGLQPEVSRFEPRLALDGGSDGLRCYRACLPWLGLLTGGGAALFEVGEGQAGDVAALLEKSGLGGIFIEKDYGGVERVVGGAQRMIRPRCALGRSEDGDCF